MNLSWVHSGIRPKRRREIYEDVVRLSEPSGSFYVMVALATVIAGYGLLADSAAVVVGAMLVAPLMGPIFGISLSLASGNRRLLRASLQSEILGIVLAVGIGVLIGLSPFRLPVGTEWLARTQPTLFDLAIALAAGLAGAYALVDERMSPALPGVAIAVAVLPPLAACGLSIAAARWDLAGGAFMLFTANFFAIQIAAAIVFSVFGMLRLEHQPDAAREDEEGRELKQFLKRFWVSILVLFVMAWFMTNTLMGLARDRRISAQIEDTLASTVSATSGARLSSSHFDRTGDQLNVSATVLTPTVFDQQQVAEMEDRLHSVLGREVNLVIRSLISRDIDRQGAAFPTADTQLEADERARVEFLSGASQIISDQIARVPGAELADINRSAPNGAARLTAVVHAPEPITPERTAEIEQALRDGLGADVMLTVRTVLIHDATSQGYAYGEIPTRAETDREAALSSARTVLDAWLRETIEGAAVRDAEMTSVEPRAITATVLTPRPLTDADAAAMQVAVQGAMGSNVQLTVQYQLGARLQPAVAGD